MVEPNFFVIGSAKSGTTSLFHYLKQHPEIAMSLKKEPHYYSRRAGAGSEISHNFSHREDPLQTGRTYPDDMQKSESGYRALFSDVVDEKAIGESSVSYLTTPGVAALIRREVPHAKIVVILRNPVERAYSSYIHMRRDGFETLSFKAGLDAEEERIRQNCHELFRYRKLGLYYNQLQEYVDLFPPEQRFFVTYDYWSRNQNDFLKQLFRFLNVRDDVSIDCRQSYNVSGEMKLRSFHMWSVRPCWWRHEIAKWVPYKFKWRVRYLFRKWNVKPKVKMPEDCRAELEKFYLNDIEKIEALLGWDLSCWKK